MPMLEYAAPWDKQPQEAALLAPIQRLIGAYSAGAGDSKNLALGIANLADTGTILRGVDSFGRAWTFDGSSTYLSCAISANRTTPFTIIAIVTPSNVTGHRQIAGFGTGGSSSGSYGLRINNGVFGAFAYSSSGTFKESAGASAAAGKTYVAGGVWETDSRRTVWVNGASGTPETTVSSITASNNFAIGALVRSGTIGFFAGNIGAVFVIEGALSDVEMAQMRTPSDVYARMFAPQIIRVPVSVGGPPPSSLSQYYQHMIG